jgi:peptide/nickel transport system permease protein
MATATSLRSVDAAERPVTRSVWNRRLTSLWRSWDARFSIVFLTGLLIVAILPTSVWPASATEIRLDLRHVEPRIAGGDSSYIFGTDALGRDVFWRIMMAAKLTLLISGLATVLATITGTAAGLAAGFLRGKTDTVISRFVDIMLAFPILLLVLALVASLGRSTISVVLVLGLSGWAGYTRVIRSATLSLSEQEFIESARCAGARNAWIITRHLLPNVASPIFVLSTLNLAAFILVESAISFLGLGPEPPDITWGGLIGDGRNYMYEAWWVTAFPGMAILLTVLAFNLIGDAMRDAFDPFSKPRG